LKAPHPLQLTHQREANDRKVLIHLDRGVSISFAATNVIDFSPNRKNRTKPKRLFRLPLATFWTSISSDIIWLCIIPVTQNPDPYTKKEWSNRLYTLSALNVYSTKV
jgi:hypothetical protein